MKPLLFGAGAMLLAAVVLLFLVRTSQAPEEESAPVAASAADAAAAVPAEEPRAAAPAAPRPTTTAPAAARPAVAAPAPEPTPATATLVVTSDVAGASVFIDRKFAGTTPLTLEAMTPGRVELKLTADGYDGIDRGVDLSAGENPVAVRFREVRLDQRIPVTHKHGAGSCEGTLRATVDGLAYETAHKNDAFVLPFAQVEIFEVDYLEKNLRVKQRGGRTWNFTDRTASNADALFVFHREVEAARKKLADGFAPVR